MRALIAGEEGQLSRLWLAQLRAVGVLEARGDAGRWNLPGTADVVAAELGCGRRAAAGLVTAAGWFAEGRSVTGEVLAPVCAVVAAGLAAGTVRVEQARVVAEAVQALPVGVRAVRGAEVETVLAGYGARVDPVTLRRLAGRVLACLDPDGSPPPDGVDAGVDAGRRGARGLRLQLNGDGSAELVGHLTPVCAGIWQTILTPLAGQCRWGAGSLARRGGGPGQGGAVTGAALA